MIALCKFRQYLIARSHSRDGSYTARHDLQSIFTDSNNDIITHSAMGHRLDGLRLRSTIQTDGEARERRWSLATASSDDIGEHRRGLHVRSRSTLGAIRLSTDGLQADIIGDARRLTTSQSIHLRKIRLAE